MADLIEYHCWVAGKREETQEIFEAPSSWAARQYIARKYDRPTVEAIAFRVLDGGTVKRVGR